MLFSEPLLEGRLIERYKRFLADILLADGSVVTAHCANPGAMLGLKEPGSRVLLSRAGNPKRKLAYNWELVEVAAGGGPNQLVGINTSRPNALVAEALRGNRLAPFVGYDRVRPEVKYGRNSRIDFLLEKDGAPPCYLEVKNCHLMRQPGFAEFPDCIAARSAKHLYELVDMVEGGARAALVYVIQMEAERFDVARDIDPVYDRAFRHALAAGVESYAYMCRVNAEGVEIERAVEIVTPHS
ncbi:DNA/RNA nuclease SfsA [Microvirga brassicacearum]|uniref:Sugar fermentation stimulation protein homolog n=1 Tax=Microvirga brassicacearum TaxID=2580413 RepID=A0A5N3P534_9HYPH|nr:DNA/RNA nuclease SfsA [Microvirga brassicacearum]KAB0264836.1 DNA/RNA nuclease SfsA [Microvirga brassicacearum]